MADSAATLADSAATLADSAATLAGDPAAEPAVTAPAGGLAADVLVEEVSIDGMCGVY